MAFLVVRVRANLVICYSIISVFLCFLKNLFLHIVLVTFGNCTLVLNFIKQVCHKIINLIVFL